MSDDRNTVIGLPWSRSGLTAHRHPLLASEML
jgi:hypothetical protein